jgi:CRP-like cAMP-binding protein
MSTPRRKRIPRPAERSFDAQRFLESAGVAKTPIEYPPLSVIFSQGDPSTTVMFIQKGTVRLSVISRDGKEAIVAMLGRGDFLGEGALAGQPVRMATVTAISACTLLVIPKNEMSRLLHDDPAFSNRFIEFMLARNIRIEEISWTSCSIRVKRLARTCCSMLRHEGPASGRAAKLSQEQLAEMIGTTRSA